MNLDDSCHERHPAAWRDLRAWGEGLRGLRLGALVSDRGAWVLWAVFALLVAWIMLFRMPTPGNVFFVYQDAARRWLAGETLYSDTGNGFIYLPHTAVLFTPFAPLPFMWGGVLWRILNISVLAIAVWRLARLANAIPERRFFFVSVPAILLSWSGARHGQMSLMMGAMMMLAVAELAAKRWWMASIWLTVAMAMKPLALVLALLAAVIYPRTAWRFFVCVSVMAIVPFLAQHPAYVWDQYLQCVPALSHAAENGDQGEFAQLFCMLHAAGFHIPEGARQGMRALAAVATLAACWFARRRLNPAELGIVLYTLAVGYLMLFNPRTENNTYCLLAPAIGVFLAEAASARNRVHTVFAMALTALFLTSYPIGRLLRDQHTVWIKPFLCTVFLIVFLQKLRAAR